MIVKISYHPEEDTQNQRFHVHWGYRYEPCFKCEPFSAVTYVAL
jgi:hypothetical protein